MHGRDVYRQVAQLHASNIDKGFLSSLGTPFLSLLYEAVDANNSSVLLIASHEGRVVGFIAGADGMGSIVRQLLRRWPRLFLSQLPAVVSPRKLAKIAETLFMGRRTSQGPIWPKAELLSIAVDPDMRGLGYAQTLYRQLIGHFLQSGVDAFRIVVGEQLAVAHRFYQGMGANPQGRVEIHRGQASTVYVHRLICAGRDAPDEGYSAGQDDPPRKPPLTH